MSTKKRYKYRLGHKIFTSILECENVPIILGGMGHAIYVKKC